MYGCLSKWEKVSLPQSNFMCWAMDEQNYRRFIVRKLHAKDLYRTIHILSLRQLKQTIVLGNTSLLSLNKAINEDCQ